jgi:hypothetical protein
MLSLSGLVWHTSTYTQVRMNNPFKLKGFFEILSIIHKHSLFTDAIFKLCLKFSSDLPIRNNYQGLIQLLKRGIHLN